MRPVKKIKYKGTASELLEPISFSNYEIKTLKHGNTGHQLYRFPSKAHGWEHCWTMDLQTAKNGILKYQQTLKNEDDQDE